MGAYAMKTWLKIAAIILLVYVHIGGLLFDVPRLDILNETIRALYFHVPMWFVMCLLYLISFVFSVMYLTGPKLNTDFYAVEFANVGTLFGMLGIFSGMIWANYTWGSPWHGDPKQNGSAIALLVYFAYFVLRGSLDNEEQRARLSAVYNIFAFFAMIPLIFIIPRLTSSMHPGNGGNPGFNGYDLDSRMRMVFYPAVIGWFLIGLWIVSLRVRIRKIQEHLFETENEKFVHDTLTAD
jgi:heme exporter protein C